MTVDLSQVLSIQNTNQKEKIIVWVALTISEKGISKPFFKPRNCSINQDIYSKYCIKRNLRNFIKKFHSDNKIIFWPDAATAHYEKITKSVYEHSKIPYVIRDHNPPNVPQLRPIEHFWAHLKNKVYDGGWSTENIDILKDRIRNTIKKIRTEYFFNLMKDVKINVRRAAKNGIDSTFS